MTSSRLKAEMTKVQFLSTLFQPNNSSTYYTSHYLDLNYYEQITLVPYWVHLKAKMKPIMEKCLNSIGYFGTISLTALPIQQISLIFAVTEWAGLAELLCWPW